MANYKDQFEEYIFELNCNTNKNIVLITHFININNDETQDYKDALNNIKDAYLEKNYNSSEEQELSAFRNMYRIAQSFDCGMENRLPCFVVFDSEKPDFFVEKSAKDIKDIFRETQNLITDIQTVKYDIPKYAERYKESRHYLLSKEILLESFRSVQYGINVQYLLDFVRSENATDCFNSEKLLGFSVNGYITFEAFVENLSEIIINKLPDGLLTELVDKYISYYSSNNVMMFPKIKKSIESSSENYLKIANKFFYEILANKKKRREEWRNRVVDDIDNTKKSIVAICLGKVVEDELHLGVFNAFRGAFKVKLPEYFDKYQEERGKIRISFSYMDNNTAKQINNMNFNERDMNHSSKLHYPNISQIRVVAFENSCKVQKQDFLNDFMEARNIIYETKSKFYSRNWSSILKKLEIIADARNHALHFSNSLSDEEFFESFKAFRYLVNVGFFETNNELKNLITKVI